MTLGDGIVTATVLLLVAAGLYLIGKHRKWVQAGKVVCGLLALLILTGLTMWGYQKYENRPHRVTEFANVQLGMKPADVKIILGEPSGVYEPDESSNLGWVYKESYSEEYSSYLVFKKSESGEQQLDIICDRSYPRLFGITDYTSLSTVLKKLGQPSYESISGDGLSKAMSYERWGASFMIEKGVVKAICASTDGRITYTASSEQDDENNGS